MRVFPDPCVVFSPMYHNSSERTPKYPSRCCSPEQLIQRPIEHIRLRLLNICAVILLNFLQICLKIHLVQADKLGLLEDLPADEKDGEKEDLGTLVSACAK